MSEPDPTLVSEQVKTNMGELLIQIARLQVQVRLLTAENDQLRQQTAQPPAWPPR